jgi:hypothetical protein
MGPTQLTLINLQLPKSNKSQQQKCGDGWSIIYRIYNIFLNTSLIEIFSRFSWLNLAHKMYVWEREMILAIKMLFEFKLSRKPLFNIASLPPFCVANDSITFNIASHPKFCVENGSISLYIASHPKFCVENDSISFYIESHPKFCVCRKWFDFYRLRLTPSFA